MEELCRRLPKGSATQRTDLLGDVQEQLNESHDVDAGDEDGGCIFCFFIIYSFQQVCAT